MIGNIKGTILYALHRHGSCGAALNIFLLTHRIITNSGQFSVFSNLNRNTIDLTNGGLALLSFICSIHSDAVQ
jgi:hypothetical protein